MRAVWGVVRVLRVFFWITCTAAALVSAHLRLLPSACRQWGGISGALSFGCGLGCLMQCVGACRASVVSGSAWKQVYLSIAMFLYVCCCSRLGMVLCAVRNSSLDLLAFCLQGRPGGRGAKGPARADHHASLGLQQLSAVCCVFCY